MYRDVLYGFWAFRDRSPPKLTWKPRRESCDDHSPFKKWRHGALYYLGGVGLADLQSFLTLCRKRSIMVARTLTLISSCEG